MTNKSFTLKGCKDKVISMDLTQEEEQDQKGLILFVHGFKGFKDWGTHHLVARYFAQNGYGFLKFNFSHNGTTAKNPLEFDDLEAFGHNTFSMELEELERVIDYSLSGKDFTIPTQIILIGHSKGGGISILETARNQKVDQLITWASTADFKQLWKKEEETAWREKGVRYIANARTHQQMPQYKVILEDLEQHQHDFNILEKAANIRQPWLIVHGTQDPAVSLKKAFLLQQANPHAELFQVEGADHVFGGRHPYFQEKLPDDLQLVCEKSLQFLNQI